MVFTNHSSQFLAASAQGETERAHLFHTLNYAHQIIAPSEQLLQSTFSLGYPSNRGSYITNGVDTNQFSPNEESRQQTRTKLNIQPHETVIFCARRIVQKCGIVFFAKALRRLQNIHDLVVLVTGFSGSLTWRDHQYEALVLEELEHLPVGIRVIKLGHVPSDDMPSYYRAADFSVLPSLVEATSIAGLESMSSGIPLIGTNVGGIPAIVKDGVDGLLVPAKDPQSLEQAMRTMVNNRDKRRSMGERAREAAISRFSWDIISQQTARVYEQAAKEFKQSGPVLL
jgi:glycosyltransferase involved in cell wall biosynthesis